ncbi:hypothetical protein [Luteimicrobium subarcticum]|uniref:Glycosyl hydrolase family 67 n=1 Tax=Luteimicrobium subarcticum TaxID=620910 RepID=A0A2M8WJ42_9MICO|nr:hypothetical protein [Luteimicrobium subarcticum]PJI90951.1 glycosyl hydrolase family 67 [Luteimicrobium subarcticum]
MIAPSGGATAPRLRTVLLVVVALLALGGVVAWQVGGVLGLSHTAADVPVERTTALPARADVAAPTVRTITAPADPAVRLAADAVADAYAGRGLTRPTVQARDTTRGLAGRALTVTVDASSDLAGESFRLARSGARISVTAGTTAGAAAALYTVADRVRSAEDVVPAAQDGTTQTSRLGLRLTDVGAVGLDDDPAKFATGDDYSLNSDVVGSAVLPSAPWVDEGAVATISQQFHGLVDHALRQGYNGVVLPGFLEYVTFADLGVYPAGDPHVARARAMVEAFGPVWQYAHDMGMKVYLQTDMLAVDPPLESYLSQHYGNLDDPSTLTSPDLWSVYQDGLHELFGSMPFVDGLMIRVGEGGSAYQLDGWDYGSKLAVTTPAAVQAMLHAFLATAGDADKDVIFRTWTVGIGAVGDLHTNPDSYDEVLGAIHDPHLVVSTKYSAGDFYSHLPLNPTLEVGDQRRIVELQARREFEGQGALPDDLGALEQAALQRFLAANPHVEGVWDWAQTGGPLYAGPRNLYQRDGLWQLEDLNAYLAGRLATDPGTDVARARADWVRQTFSSDPLTVAALSRMFALSRSAITDGLYIGPYANQSVKALGLEPPPMMWIFEWDIVSGDTATFDTIYTLTKNAPGQDGSAVDDAIAQGHDAVATAATMHDLVAGTAPSTWTDPAQRTQLLDALAYEQDLLGMLAEYRETRLRQAQWLDTGSSSAQDAWKAAEARFRSALAAHEARYGDDVDLPAYNATAAGLGLARADRDVAMAWLARGLLVVGVAALGLGAWSRRRPRFPGHRALQALWTGGVTPWRLGPPATRTDARAENGGADDDGAGGPGRTDRVLVWALPAVLLVASRLAYTWFVAPVHLALTLGAWAVFALVVRLLVGRRAGFALWGAVGGVVVLRSVLLLASLSWRGPGRYWFGFWTLPGPRAAYVTVAFAAFCWLFVATFFALRAAYGASRRRAVGAVALAVGAVLAVGGAVVAAIGLETVLTAWNDQMALLPWGLHRILGFCVYLGIPTSLPTDVAIAGAAVAAVGAVLLVARRRAQGAG